MALLTYKWNYVNLYNYFDIYLFVYILLCPIQYKTMYSSLYTKNKDWGN